MTLANSLRQGPDERGRFGIHSMAAASSPRP